MLRTGRCLEAHPSRRPAWATWAARSPGSGLLGVPRDASRWAGEDPVQFWVQVTRFSPVRRHVTRSSSSSGLQGARAQPSGCHNVPSVSAALPGQSCGQVVRAPRGPDSAWSPCLATSGRVSLDTLHTRTPARGHQEGPRMSTSRTPGASQEELLSVADSVKRTLRMRSQAHSWRFATNNDTEPWTGVRAAFPGGVDMHTTACRP